MNIFKLYGNDYGVKKIRRILRVRPYRGYDIQLAEVKGANFGEIEINFWKVSGDDKLEDLFGELSGNEQKAIFYMLNDIEPESKIHLIK